MTAGERRRAGRLLLALLGPCVSEYTAPTGADGAWHHAARIAREHRLGPHLYGQLRRAGGLPDVPETIADEWADAYRSNAFLILAQRHAMGAALTMLASAGIEAVALKGAALAWTVWPAPAERPMRDLDLLVPQDRAAEAYRTLREAEWQGADMTEPDLARMAETETHLPPLVSAHGITLELHGHVWRSAPLAGRAMPACDSSAYFARATFSAEASGRIPAPDDMLAHLIVHAACSHLFNVGPLALADIDYWLAAHAIDWTTFWDRAEQDGFARPAALMIALIDRWRRPGLLSASACPSAPRHDIVDEAEALLFQDTNARKDINLIAGLRGGIGSARGRIKRHPLDEYADTPRSFRFVARGLSLARSLANGPTRESGLGTHRIARWLEG